MNALMTWLGFLGLAAISGQPGYKLWETAILGGSKMTPQGYALAEIAATLVIAGIGVTAPALTLFGYYFGEKTQKSIQINRRGRGAQDMAAMFLRVAPIAFLSLLAFWALVYSHPPALLFQFFDIPKDVTIVDIYKTSILRTFPYVIWFIGPFSIVLDIVGDVLFYLQPEKKHPVAIAEVCQMRLRAALNYIKYQMPDHLLVVVAHSQGSVIAADLRKSGEVPFPMITAGSPIDSLYNRFLGKDLKGNPAQAGEWINCYRDDDVIGGPINAPEIKNLNIGMGGHMNYWNDKEFAKIINNISKYREN